MNQMMIQILNIIKKNKKKEYDDNESKYYIKIKIIKKKEIFMNFIKNLIKNLKINMMNLKKIIKKLKIKMNLTILNRRKKIKKEKRLKNILQK